MADLLGRKGKLKEAFKLIQNMPVEPDAGVWGALLGACRAHHEVKVAKNVANRLFILESRASECCIICGDGKHLCNCWEVGRCCKDTDNGEM